MNLDEQTTKDNFRAGSAVSLEFDVFEPIMLEGVFGGGCALTPPFFSSPSSASATCPSLFSKRHIGRDTSLTLEVRVMVCSLWGQLHAGIRSVLAKWFMHLSDVPYFSSRFVVILSGELHGILTVAAGIFDMYLM